MNTKQVSFAVITRKTAETPNETLTGELTGQALVDAIETRKRQGIFAGESELSIPSAVRELLPEITAENIKEASGEGYEFEAKITTGGMFRQSTRTTRKNSETGETVPTEYLVVGFSAKHPETGDELNVNNRKSLAPSGDTATILKLKPNTPAKYICRWDAGRVVPNSTTKGAWNATLTV